MLLHEGGPVQTKELKTVPEGGSSEYSSPNSEVAQMQNKEQCLNSMEADEIMQKTKLFNMSRLVVNREFPKETFPNSDGNASNMSEDECA